MRYMMMVYQPEVWHELTDEEKAESYAVFEAFHNELGPRIQFAERLHASVTATTVKIREGKLLTTDGPFAESKEQMGGIYIFDCEDLDEAIEIAAKIPTAKSGTIEIRPIFEPEPEMSNE